MGALSSKIQVCHGSDYVEHGDVSVQAHAGQRGPVAQTKAATTLGKPTYEAALVMVCEMYPKEAPQLRKYSHDIIACAMGAAAPPHSNLLDFASPLPPAFDDTKVVQVRSMTPCILAICTFLAQAVGIVLSILGLPQINDEILINIISRELGGDVLSGFARMITAFTDAHSTWDKAIALCNIISRFYNVGGQLLMDIITKSIHEMHMWDWAVAFVRATAQILAWVSTGFLGMAAEVVLILANFPALFEAAAAVGTDCGGQEPDLGTAATQLVERATKSKTACSCEGHPTLLAHGNVPSSRLRLAHPQSNDVPVVLRSSCSCLKVR